MSTDEELKELVKQKYSEIALQEKETNQSSCCGAGGCCDRGAQGKNRIVEVWREDEVFVFFI